MLEVSEKGRVKKTQGSSRRLVQWVNGLQKKAQALSLLCNIKFSACETSTLTRNAKEYGLGTPFLCSRFSKDWLNDSMRSVLLVWDQEGGD